MYTFMNGNFYQLLNIKFYRPFSLSLRRSRDSRSLLSSNDNALGSGRKTVESLNASMISYTVNNCRCRKRWRLDISP